eukprot:gene30743-37145_t
MEAKQQEIDESLYSRQLYVMGHEAQKRMALSSVLIVGLDGLGVETSKNIVLAGVKSLSLLDDTPCSWIDLSSQFYLDESSLGRGRAEVSLPRLAELNPYVQVNHLTGSVLEAVQKANFNVVVLINQETDVVNAVTDYCHAHNIAVLLGDCRGVFGEIFCDFTSSHTLSDVDGEPAVSSIIANISQDNPALVTVLEDTRHNLNFGDRVRLSGVKGMVEVNDRVFNVTVKDPFSFEIDCDTSLFGGYEGGGYAHQVKGSRTIAFSPYSQCVYSPGEITGDISKYDSAAVLHVCFIALRSFQQRHHRLPGAGNMQDAEEFVRIAREVVETHSTLPALPAPDSSLFHLPTQFSLCCQGQLSPLCAVLGGVLGQEVLKFISGKFFPITQFYVYDGADALPAYRGLGGKLGEGDEAQGLGVVDLSALAPRGDRYDGQRVVFGDAMQQKLGSLSTFIVGAGAIGCEMLKTFAMMGVSCDTGVSYITDMDHIEKSNLSRQFLFRNEDINKPKSITAARAVTRMNPRIKLSPMEQKVCTETENIFHDDFYEAVDIIVTALDNVEARLYVDNKAVFYQKVLLESGTLGTKGHTQVVVPHLTENYGATRDPPEKSIPVCTLKHFPNLIEHTLQWAREWYEEVFKQSIEDTIMYLKDREGFLKQLAAQQNMRLDTLKRVKEVLVDHRSTCREDCVKWARLTFDDLFNHRIQQLLFNFPLDRRTSNGTPFWSGAKKPPTPLTFDPTDPLHLECIHTLATLRASVYGGDVGAMDLGFVASVAAAVAVPPFRPQEGVKIAATDEELKTESQGTNNGGDIDSVCDSIIRALPDPSSLSSLALRAFEFDKDNDATMRVVAAVGNLRARNYAIPEVDLHTSRGIAGKITPAISTTTALVTGAICMELYKILQKKPAEKLANTFTNLALPLFTSMQPEPPKTTKSIVKCKDFKFTQWDVIDIAGEMTVQMLFDYMAEHYGVELSMLSAGV